MDARTMAFINMYAVLGTLEQLCKLSPKARELLGGADIEIGFSVKNCFDATLSFKDGGCMLFDGCEGCDIKLPFSTPEKFNGMIDGTVTPFPSKGFTKIKFLTGTFTKLTDLLSRYLRPQPGDLDDEEFFVTSTTMMLHLIAAACAQVGNEDKIGRASAGYITDGMIKLGIANGPTAGISAKNHRLSVVHREPEAFTSYMIFQDIRLARALFDGKVNAVSCIGEGKIRMGGMISQVDNVNRILDRVSLYLS